jgi:uncharacterized protein YwqG
MNTNLERLLKQLRDRVAANPELSELNLPQIARPAVRLVTRQVPQAQFSLGESRIGGTPDVPRGFEWPRWLPSKQRDDKFGQPWHPNVAAPLGFIAQIDLSAVPKVDDSLPNSGWLYFFYDRYCETWGFDPSDRGCCRILYADCERSELGRAMLPSDADSEHVAHPCKLQAWAELTLPDDLPDLEYGTPIYEAYRELSDDLTKQGGLTHHHLFGYPQLIQNPMELECQLASNGVYCGNSEGYQGDRAKALAEGASEWMLLLQIDTDEEGPGWMWGDVGRIYYWIKRKDLASLQFQDVWLIFQCC